MINPFKEEITIQSIDGMQVSLMKLGARIKSFTLPYLNKVLHITEPISELMFKEKIPYSGATIGAFASRISDGEFSLNNKRYKLAIDQDGNCLHGGPNGLHSKVWDLKEHTKHSATFITQVNDLEDGFPGNRTFQIKYEFSDDELQLSFGATTDKDTHINMTHHVYFNLDTEEHMDNHLFLIQADGALELNHQKVPTGNIIPPTGEFNFSQFNALNNRQFDHNFVLSKPSLDHISAAVYCTTTDITLEVSTDQPGLQFYTGHGHYFAMETQHFPDTPNQPNFPSTLVKAGASYQQKCWYRIVR